MLKSYQSIGLLLGTFLLAYAGFLYAGYIERNQPSDEQRADAGYPADSDRSTVIGGSAVAPSAATPHDKNRSTGNYHDHGDSTTTARQSERTSDNNKSDKTDRRSTQGLTAEQVEDRQNAMQAFEQYRQDRETDPERSTADAASKPRGLTVATGISGPGTTSTGVKNDSPTRSPAPGTPGSSRAPVTVSPLSTQPVKPTVTADNDTATGTSQVDDSEEDSRVIETGSEPPVMATPDCPAILPDNTTDDEIGQMLSAYGCRYRKSCTMKNDGTRDYNCHWEFIRPA